MVGERLDHCGFFVGLFVFSAEDRTKYFATELYYTATLFIFNILVKCCLKNIPI